jgi:uncharacterized membrane protein YsdA (DUF1294 family)
MPEVDLLSVATYLALINGGTFATFAWDKYCALSGRWRVMESTLLGMVAAGGTIGAICAQHWLRHKTRKEPFRTRLFLIAGAQVLALGALSIPEVRETAFLPLDQHVSASVRAP